MTRGAPDPSRASAAQRTGLQSQHVSKEGQHVSKEINADLLPDHHRDLPRDLVAPLASPTKPVVRTLSRGAVLTLRSQCIAPEIRLRHPLRLLGPQTSIQCEAPLPSDHARCAHSVA